MKLHTTNSKKFYTKIVIVVTLCFSSYFSFGQKTKFQKNYSASYSKSIANCKEGGYIICGTTLNSGHIYLLRINENGDTIWTKHSGAGGHSYGTNIIQTLDKSFIVSGYSNAYGSVGNIWYVVKFDSLGNLKWRKDFYVNQGAEYPGKMIEVNSNKIVIVGTVGSYATRSHIGILAIDSMGNILWNKQYGKNGTEVMSYNFLKVNNGYLITGRIDINNTNNFSLYIIRTNEIGDTLWTKILGNTEGFDIASLVVTSDNNYVVAGNYTTNGNIGDAFLMKIDSVANIIWFKRYSYNGYIIFNVLKETNSRGLILGGRVMGFPTYRRDALALETDTTGNILWSKTYNQLYDDIINDISIASDGGYFFIGESNVSASNTNTLLIKTDSLGQSGCQEYNESSIVIGLDTLYEKYFSTIFVNSTMTQLNTGGFSLPYNDSITTFCFFKDTILPTSLHSFTATPQQSKVLLQWQTATETNNDYFTVQRSSNSDNWQDITTIKGAGNSSVAKKYTSTDNNPLQGTSYYRIKQTDFNGSVSYSEVRRVELGTRNLGISVYPNPASKVLHINTESKATIKIYNVVGKQVSIHNLAKGDNSINIEQLSKGVYVAVIETANGVVTKKIVKE